MESVGSLEKITTKDTWLNRDNLHNHNDQQAISVSAFLYIILPVLPTNRGEWQTYKVTLFCPFT